MITLGLTGSIGMGKTTTATMFRDRGIPVWDADAAVHRLYGPEGAGAQALSKVFEAVTGPDGVDRAALRALVLRDPGALKRIEAIIHPLVSQDRAAFLDAQAQAELVVCDIPLLFETGADQWLDKIAVVSTDAARQRARVLDRPGMTPEQLEMILSKQVPDAEKRTRADFVIDTTTMDSAMAGVDHVLSELMGRGTDA